MPLDNKAVLEKANAAIVKGDNEGFLAHCTEDTEWTFVGEQTLVGKDAVREWMKESYKTPPQFMVTELIADGDFVVALGTIQLPDENGKIANHSYCDVWKFADGKMCGLQAFVLKSAD
jgi:uncharacterized protein